MTLRLHPVRAERSALREVEAERGYAQDEAN